MVANDISKVLVLSILPQSIYLLYRNPNDAVSVFPFNTVMLAASFVILVVGFMYFHTLLQYAYVYLFISIFQCCSSVLAWTCFYRKKENMIYDFIFVVLVYRNTSDLVDFFASLKLERTRVIVVNSFYDKESELQFKQIAESNHADFLSVPNKGYGAGNNRGVEYALKHYDFKYLVISNADVEIKNWILQNWKNMETVFLLLKF